MFLRHPVCSGPYGYSDRTHMVGPYGYTYTGWLSYGIDFGKTKARIRSRNDFILKYFRKKQQQKTHTKKKKKKKKKTHTYEVMLNNKHYARHLFAPFASKTASDLFILNKKARPYACGKTVYTCTYMVRTVSIASTVHLMCFQYILVKILWHCAMLNLIFHTSYLSHVCEEFARINHFFACVMYTYSQFWDFNSYEFLQMWCKQVWKIFLYLSHLWQIPSYFHRCAKYVHFYNKLWKLLSYFFKTFFFQAYTYL